MSETPRSGTGFGPWQTVAEVSSWRIGHPRAKLVLVAVAMCCGNDEREGFLSIGRIAVFAECSVNTARKWLARLEESGWLDREPRHAKGGRQTSNLYRIRQGKPLDDTDEQEHGGGSTPRVEGGPSTPGVEGGGSTPRVEGGGSTPGVEPHSIEDQKEEPKEDLPAKPTRRRNAAFDALLEIEGQKPGEVTKLACAAVGRALRDIRQVCPGSEQEVADEIMRRAAVYRAQWPTWTLSALALAKHWGKCSEAACQTTAVLARRQVRAGISDEEDLFFRR